MPLTQEVYSETGDCTGYMQINFKDKYAKKLPLSNIQNMNS